MTPATLADTPLAALLEALAAKTPAPGGGATACWAGALAAAQAGMVVAYSLGKKDLAPHADLHRDATGILGAARHLLLQLADEDAAAYARLNALQRLPQADPGRAGLGDAARACVQIPLAALAACLRVVEVCRSLEGASNRHLASDLEISVDLARCAARACGVNVRVNLAGLADEAERAAAAKTLGDLLARV